MFSLTARERRMLEKSWAKLFAEKIFPLINEENFSALYSDKASRPNTPVNVIVGSMVLEELMGLTDEEFMDSLMVASNIRKLGRMELWVPRSCRIPLTRMQLTVKKRETKTWLYSKHCGNCWR